VDVSKVIKKKQKRSPVKKRPSLARTKNLQKKNILKPTSRGSVLYLGNLRYDKTEDGLKKMLSVYGPVKWVKIVCDLKTKLPKGIAFIRFQEEEDLHKAIRGLDGKKVEGRTLKASVAIDKVKAPMALETSKEKKQKDPAFDKKREDRVSRAKKKSDLDNLMEFLKEKKSK
jgi:RNA recognition motif-containing protein